MSSKPPRNKGKEEEENEEQEENERRKQNQTRLFSQIEKEKQEAEKLLSSSPLPPRRPNPSSRSSSARPRQQPSQKKKNNNTINPKQFAIPPGQPVRTMTKDNLQKMTVVQNYDFLGKKRQVTRTIESVPTEKNPYYDPNNPTGGGAVHSVKDLRPYTEEELRLIAARTNEEMYIYDDEEAYKAPPRIPDEELRTLKADMHEFAEKAFALRRNLQKSNPAAHPPKPSNRAFSSSAMQKNNNSSDEDNNETTKGGFQSLNKEQQDANWKKLCELFKEADEIKAKKKEEQPFQKFPAHIYSALMGLDKTTYKCNTAARLLNLYFRPLLLAQSPELISNEMNLTRLMNGFFALAFLRVQHIPEDNTLQYTFRMPTSEINLHEDIKGMAFDFHMRFSVQLSRFSRLKKVGSQELITTASNGAPLLFKSCHVTISVPSSDDPEDEHIAITKADSRKRRRQLGKLRIIRAPTASVAEGIHVIPSAGVAALTGKAAKS